MATRLYLRFDTTFGQPYSSGEQSTALPVGTANNSGGATRNLSVYKGTFQANGSYSSLAQTAHQDGMITKYVSDTLTVPTIDANTWTIALATAESNANANFFTALSLYVLTSADTVRGFIYDSDVALGNEWGLTEDGQIYTISGSAVTGISSTDRLCLEVWYHAVQATATAFTINFYYNGTVDVTAGANTDAASYIETPQVLFAPLTPRTFNPVPFM
jgi:hypothetical protein